MSNKSLMEDWEIDSDRTVFEESVGRILEQNSLCSIATTDQNGLPHVNSAFFAYDTSNWRFYFIFEVPSDHATNSDSNSRAAISVVDTHQEWNGELKGCFMSGKIWQASLLELPHTAKEYAQRFFGAKELIAKLKTKSAYEALGSRFYIFEPNLIKLLDFKAFGDDNVHVASRSTRSH